MMRNRRKGLPQSSLRPFKVLLLLSMTMDGLRLGCCQTAGFCSRAQLPLACPSPPTVSSLRIQDYVGTFYEIGSTAGYRLRNEVGTICNKANQTLLEAGSRGGGGGGTLRAEFSGVRVVGSDVSAAIAEVSGAATSICWDARQICAGIEAGSSMRQAMASISAVRARLATQNMQAMQVAALSQAMQTVGASLSLLRAQVESLASQVQTMQLMNSQLSQLASSGPEIAALRRSTSSALHAAQALAGLLRGNLTVAGSQVAGVASALAAATTTNRSADVAALDAAVETMGKAVEEMTVSASDVEAQLGRAAARFSSMIQGGATNGANVTVQFGATIVQQVATLGGRMVANLGSTTTHWDVLVAERGHLGNGYRTVLVYSCTEPTNGATTPTQDLILFSRTSQLPYQTINRMLTVANSYGILTHCDSPFLLSLQPSNCN